MANSYSTQDCVKGALQRAGERTDGSSVYHQLALKYVNQVYKDVIKGNSIFAPDTRDAWSWARQTSSLIVPGYYNSDSVSLTNNSSVGTFSVAPTLSLQGYFFRVIDRPTFYRISSHTASSTSFTLDSVYVEATGTALPYVAMPLICDLGGSIQRLVEPMRIYLNRVLELGENATDMGRIYGLDPLEFWKDYPLQLVQNDTPSKFTVISRGESSWKVQFNKYTTNPMRVDYDFIAIPSDLIDASDSIPLVPRDDRDLLEVGAAFYLWTDKKSKEDAATNFQATQAKILALRENERSSQKFAGKNYGQLIARRDDTAIPYWVINR